MTSAWIDSEAIHINCLSLTQFTGLFLASVELLYIIMHVSCAAETDDMRTAALGHISLLAERETFVWSCIQR